MNQDDEHLRLLSIFHYIVGGLIALMACFPIIHLVVGLFLLFAPESMGDSKGGPPPRLFGLLFAIFAGVFILVGWVIAVSVFIAGRSLARRKHYMFCMIVAALSCMIMPFGTVLGIFTILVLNRPSVRAQFH